MQIVEFVEMEDGRYDQWGMRNGRWKMEDGLQASLHIVQAVRYAWGWKLPTPYT